MVSLMDRKRLLFNHMSMHIGEFNHTTRPQILRAVFPDKNHNPKTLLERYEQNENWRRVVGMLTHLRKSSKMFVVGKRETNEWIYFVVKSSTEAGNYTDRLEVIRKGLKKSEERCIEAVESESWRLVEPIQIAIRKKKRISKE